MSVLNILIQPFAKFAMKLKEKNFHNLKEVDKEFSVKLKTIDVSVVLS